MAHYKIVRDRYLGYEVRVWRWWFPFWMQAGFTNTHSSVDAAERWARERASGCVKHLGQLS